MSKLNPTPSQIRWKEKSRLKKKKEREAKKAYWDERCPNRHVETESWDCGCSFGCDMCNKTKKCKHCGHIF